ncbi:MAG: hypothetical protein JJE55_12330 [Flavobacteriaceae bacterium]|nr:hypothetical protein [Flavobacteriaceae bacterium]
MKTLAIILSMIGLVSLNSCKQQKDPQAVLENPETRTEVFNAITENDDYMAGFMESMHNNPQAMQMMQGNRKMMGSMMQGGGMQMMMKDSMMMKNMMGNKTMMHEMMNGMMKSPETMNSMMQMMHQNGMMSEDCMESCKKMMGEKGMDLPAGKSGMQNMNKMGSPIKENHTEHH